MISQDEVTVIVTHNDFHADVIVEDPDTPEAYTDECPICTELLVLRNEGPDAFCMSRYTTGAVCTRPKGHAGRHYAIDSSRCVMLAWTTQ